MLADVLRKVSATHSRCFHFEKAPFLCCLQMENSNDRYCVDYFCYGSRKLGQRQADCEHHGCLLLAADFVADDLLKG